MSIQSGQSAVLDLDTSGDKGQTHSNKGFKYLTDDSSFASTSYGLTEVDEYSERRSVNDNPLLPNDVVEDRSEIESIIYRSNGFFLFHFASGWDTLFMAVATICGIGAGITLVAHMHIFGEITDVFTSTRHDTFELVGDDCVGYVVLSLGVFVLSALNMYLWCLVKERQLIRVRQLLIQSLFTKDIAWFDQPGATDICSERLSDIEALEHGMGENIAVSVQWVFSAVALLINALVQSPDVTGVIFPYFPCILLAAVGSYLIIKSYTNRENEGKKQVKAAMIPTIENMKIISAFKSQEFESTRLYKIFRFARHMTFRKYLCFGIQNGSFWMLAFYTLATGGWYASYLVLDDRVTPGETMQAILGILMSGIFIGQIYPCLECILKAKEAAQNLINILDENLVINRNQKLGRDLPVGNVDIGFSDVHFSYPSALDQQVLNGFRLKVKANQTVALVGPTGSGKSSVLRLILRFYDAKKGEVLINGINIKEMKLQNFRRYIGVVGQEASLLANSIADNIRLGHEAVTKEQIINAAKLANAHEFIIRLPEGYNSIIGEGGIQLKPDEKLRISLARALVRNPKILLLDEVTSALDSASEGIVLEAIEKAKNGRTTIITSHRLANIQNADLIVAMKDGKAVEQGTHQQLMDLGGLYYEMWTVQSCMPKEKMNDYIFEVENDNRSIKGDKNGTNWMAVYSHRKLVPNPETDTSEDDADEQVPRFKVPRFFHLVKRLLKLNLPEWSFAVIGCITSICVGLIAPFYALSIAEFIYIFSMPSADDQYRARRDEAAKLLVVGAFLAPINYLQNFTFAESNGKFTLRLRDLLCKALFKQEMSYFDNPKNNRNTLVNIFIRDAVDVNGATFFKCVLSLQAVTTIISSIVISFVYCWQLAIPMLGIFLPTLIIVSYFTGRLYSPVKSSKANKLQGRIRKMTKEAFGNIKLLAILVKEEFFIRKCRNIFQLMYRKKMSEAIRFGIIFGFNEGIVYLAFAVAFSIGSYLVQHGMVDFISIYKVLGTVLIGSLMTGRLCWNTPDFRRGRIAAERLFPLAEMVPADSSTEEEDKKTSLEQCKGAVSFKNVTFKDPKRSEIIVLDDFTMSIEAGETVAIVGTKNSEKNAIVELMERFYSPHSGTIKLDNVDIGSYELDWYRSQISVVKQEALFPDISIADNILYGSSSEITQVIETCQTLNIHEFLASLPNGYDTKLGDVVLPFHIERLVVARALVRDAQIVFLDCENLALNLPNEKDVQETMFRALAEKTTIILAHRVSRVEKVNKIMVVNQGKVVEVGSHDGLMAAEGIYFRLVMCQQNLK